MRKFLVVLAMSTFAVGPALAQQTGGAAEGAGSAITAETVGTVLFFTLIAALVVGAIASSGDDDSTVTHSSQ